MNILIIGSLEGNKEIYLKLKEICSKYGSVSSPIETAQLNQSDNERYNRAFDTVKEAELIIAECSSPSFGCGMELREAASLGKPVVVVHKKGTAVSGLIKGAPNVEQIIEYDDMPDIKPYLNSFTPKKMIVKKKVGGGIGVMLMRNGKLLLGRRHDDKDKADSALRGEGTWTMPGGKLDFGESFEEAARKEVIEETGLVLNNLEVMCVNNDKNEHAHFVTVGLFCDNSTGEAEVLEPDEIVEWRWFSLDELPSPLFPPSARMIENYKTKKFHLDV